MQDAALIKSKVIILFKSVMDRHLTVSILKRILANDQERIQETNKK